MNHMWMELGDDLREPPIEPERCDHGCHDLKPTESACNWWVLVIEEGRAEVKCQQCRCSYDPVLWDGGELLFSDDIPVSVEFDHCSASWHGENRCDHGWSILLSPRSR